MYPLVMGVLPVSGTKHSRLPLTRQAGQLGEAGREGGGEDLQQKLLMKTFHTFSQSFEIIIPFKLD